MSDGDDIGGIIRRPFHAGETAIIIEPHGKKHFVPLRTGDKFHHLRTGHLLHDDIIGRPPGALIKSQDGVPVVCLRLTVEDFILKRLRRRTSIIHPKDLATVVARGDVFPGARVMEAGIGSGATSIVLLRHLGPGGQLISYERREEFIEGALQNIRDAHRLLGEPGARHRVVTGNVYDGSFVEGDFDTILLDVPEPHRAEEGAFEALRPGGILLCWLPTVTQVYMLGLELQQKRRWGVVETRETVERPWEVVENAMRPYHRMIGHTGFLIRARKLEVSG